MVIETQCKLRLMGFRVLSVIFFSLAPPLLDACALKNMRIEKCPNLSANDLRVGWQKLQVQGDFSQ